LNQFDQKIATWIPHDYLERMTPVYSSGFQPNPLDTLDVLAFVLCAPGAFVPGGNPQEMAEVEKLIQPAKAEAIRRWQEARDEKKVS